MPDDQNTKPTTIDDLVKELSKSSGNPPTGGPPPNLPGVKVGSGPMPQPPTPRPQMTSPPASSGGAPKPFVPTPPLPQTSGPTKPVVPTQEYRSSIRTMGEDLSSIKAGQKPAGVDVPRQITPDQPRVGAVPIPTPMTGPKLPVGPPHQVGLGGTEKTGPLSAPAAPGMPKVGPAPTLPKPSPVQPLITVPTAKKGFPGPSLGLGLGRTAYIIIAGVLIVGGFMYWFLILRTSTPEVVVTPIPSPAPSPTPTVKSLSSIFGGTPVNFEVAQGQNIAADLKIFIEALNIAKGGFTEINLMEDFQGTLVPIGLLDMFDIAPVVYPAGLRDQITDSIVAAYGQSEGFNADGSVNFNSQGSKEVVFAARVKNKLAVEAIMTDWETTIVNDLAKYLLVSDTSKEASVNFLDNSYRDASIRYKNFPLPDASVDYSVINASGQSYLIIAGSREAMYSAIDAITAQ